MKKTFTPELISAIVTETSRLISLIPANEAGQGETKVDGVDLTVVVRIPIQNAFGTVTRRTVDVIYGRMVIVYDFDDSLLLPNAFANSLRIILSSSLGDNHERIDMQQLTDMIRQQNVAHIMNSSSGMGHLTMTRPAEFKVELPGGVVFSRTGTSLSVVKGNESMYALSSTIPQIIEQHLNQAAHLAISYADIIHFPARTVDTSIDSVLLNGVLYVKIDDKKNAYYFNDERTKAFVARQNSQHFAYGLIHSPNQQFNYPFNVNSGPNINSMRPGGYNKY